MERITFEGNFCDISMCRENPCPYNGMCSQRQTWERLKEYEDTGLEPEEIIGLKNTCDQLHGINDSLFNANQAMGKDLAEWKKANDEGRLVALPCKLGDDVWFVRKFGKGQCIKRAEVSCINIDFRGEVFVSARRISGGYIGKTVFLTREEAEAALAQKGGTHEADSV